MDQATKAMSDKEGKYLTFSMANEEYGIGILKIKEIIKMPITYIVPAIWGAKKDGELTAAQKEINEQVAPLK